MLFLGLNLAINLTFVRFARPTAQVHDLKQYGAADFAFSHRYVDVVATDEKGRIVADLTRISHVEPE